MQKVHDALLLQWKRHAPEFKTGYEYGSESESESGFKSGCEARSRFESGSWSESWSESGSRFESGCKSRSYYSDLSLDLGQYSGSKSRSEFRLEYGIWFRVRVWVWVQVQVQVRFCVRVWSSGPNPILNPMQTSTWTRSQVWTWTQTWMHGTFSAIASSCRCRDNKQISYATYIFHCRHVGKHWKQSFT